MSKITNDGLTLSDTGCSIAVPMTTVDAKGLILLHFLIAIIDAYYLRAITHLCKATEARKSALASLYHDIHVQ